jgi:hypothetical protein
MSKLYEEKSNLLQFLYVSGLVNEENTLLPTKSMNNRYYYTSLLTLSHINYEIVKNNNILPTT